MAKGKNLVILIGNLGDDPTVRNSERGMVASISLGCTESWKDQSGQKKEYTEWVRCVAFGKLAEIIEKYAKKGQQVYIEGKMRTREYEKDGQKRHITEVVINEFQMLGHRSESSNEQRGQNGRGGYTSQPQSQPQSQVQQPQRQNNFDDFDDDIPF